MAYPKNVFSGPEEQLLCAIFEDSPSIVRQKKTGKFLARSALRKINSTKSDSVFDNPWQALEWLREVRKEPNLTTDDVRFDVASYEALQVQ